MQNPEDKISLNVKDDEKLSELFSRKEPGDKVKFSGVATLDENEEGVVILGIEEFTVQEPKKKAESESDSDSAAVRMMKSKQSQAAEESEDDGAEIV